MRPLLIVSVHDVAPVTEWATRYWATELDRRRVPATYLAVPGPWEGRPLRSSPELARWLRDRADAGDEIAQHGWAHRADDGGTTWQRAVGAVAARGCAEFWTMNEREAHRRLEAGRRVLRAAGLEPVGFTPPGWLASLATERALANLGFRYTTSYLGVTDLRTGARHRIPAFSHRPGGVSEALGAAVFGTLARRMARDHRSIRLALHPRDLTSPRLVAVTLRAMDRFLDAGFRPCTYHELVLAHAPPAADDRAA